MPNDLTVGLQRAAAVSGRLVDEMGVPIAGAQLSGENLVTTDYLATELRYQTDEDGRFELRGIIPGVQYDIRALEGYRFLGDVLRGYSVNSAGKVDGWRNHAAE